MSPVTIKLTALRILATNKPYAVPFESLLTEVNRLVRPAVTPEMLKVQLRALLDQSMVDFLTEELDLHNEDLRRWFIREAGEAALRK